MTLDCNTIHYGGYEVHEDHIAGNHVFYIQTKGHGAVYCSTFDEVRDVIDNFKKEGVWIPSKQE